MKDRNVEEKDIENVLKILEDFSASETSRLKIQVSEEETPGKAERVYHYGRCDVGSPWARGECYDLPEQDLCAGTLKAWYLGIVPLGLFSVSNGQCTRAIQYIKIRK